MGLDLMSLGLRPGDPNAAVLGWPSLGRADRNPRRLSGTPNRQDQGV
jgi:hypothetical protein